MANPPRPCCQGFLLRFEHFILSLLLILCFGRVIPGLIRLESVFCELLCNNLTSDYNPSKVYVSPLASDKPLEIPGTPRQAISLHYGAQMNESSIGLCDICGRGHGDCQYNEILGTREPREIPTLSMSDTSLAAAKFEVIITVVTYYQVKWVIWKIIVVNYC